MRKVILAALAAIVLAGYASIAAPHAARASPPAPSINVTAEAETLAATRGRTPIALYDDVFAELDQGRQARLLELIRAVLPGQAIVAAPRDVEVPAALFDRPRWQMREGQIQP